MLTYSLIDKDPFDVVTYYRLKQTDYDGHFTYSGIVAADDCNEEVVTIFPNPLTGDVLYVQSIEWDNSIAEVVIKDMPGRVCFSGRLVLDGSRQQLERDAFLTPGVYVVTVISNDRMLLNQKLVVK